MNNFILTREEHKLVTDPGIFYTKHSIIQKVYALFGHLNSTYNETLLFNSFLPEAVKSVPPKIYRGENYRQLPYVMLDHPRFFKSQDAFAIRSLFWWGQHFSIHLVLGGQYVLQFAPAIGAGIKNKLNAKWFYSFTNDPWNHQFEEGNYKSVSGLNSAELKAASSSPYIKIGSKLSLDEWDNADHFFTSSFLQIIELLTGNDQD